MHQSKNLKLKNEFYINLLSSQLNMEVNWYEKIDSTNMEAKRFLLHNKYSHPVLIGSEMQTAGYGKKKRNFVSNIGGIYLSLIIKVPQLSIKNQGLLTTGIAWEMSLAIKECFNINTKFKWVNDILFNNKKVAGILVEIVRPKIAIIGIGCNLYQPNIQQKVNNAGNLLTYLPNETNICSFIINIISKLINFIPNFERTNFLNSYKQRMILMNRKVTFKIGNQIISGKVIDLSPEAYLIIRTNSSRKILNAGDIIQIK